MSAGPVRASRSIRTSRPGRSWWVLLPMLSIALWLAWCGDKTPVQQAVPPAAQAPQQAQTGLPAIQAPAASQQTASSTPSPTPSLTRSSPSTLPPTLPSSVPSSVPSTLPPALAPMLLVPRSLLIPAHGQPRQAPRDLFAVRSWAAVTSPPAPVVAPAPTAPPVPFIYLGKRLDGAGWQVFLGRADQTFIVSAGSTIDGIYRIDAVNPPTLGLTYLPLGQAQLISIGEAP